MELASQYNFSVPLEDHRMHELIDLTLEVLVPRSITVQPCNVISGRNHATIRLQRQHYRVIPDAAPSIKTCVHRAIRKQPHYCATVHPVEAAEPSAHQDSAV